MTKIKSFDELKQLKEQHIGAMRLRTAGENPGSTVVAVGMGQSGIEAGAKAVLIAFSDIIAEKDLTDVRVIAVSDLGGDGPLVEIRKHSHKPYRFINVTPELAREIVEQHLVGAKPIKSGEEA